MGNDYEDGKRRERESLTWIVSQGHDPSEVNDTQAILLNGAIEEFQVMLQDCDSEQGRETIKSHIAYLEGMKSVLD